MTEHVIQLKNITKQFPGVLANDNISLEIKKGEVFAIVGENGAGKSTLMKIMYGLYKPTAGEVYIKGEKIQNFNPKTAIDKGVGMVHQHFMLVPSFTIAQNVVLGMELRKNNIFVDEKKAIESTKKISEEYGLKVDPKLPVEMVSVGIQQRVEILKTLYRGADVLILDEPTAVLTPQETEELFVVIRRLVKEMGKTVIIITHKLNEVLAISNRVAVMRAGKLIGIKNTNEVDEKILSEMMVGKEVLFDKLHKENKQGEVLVQVDNLKAKDKREFMALNGVSFQVKAGEILGVAGIEGNGQTELIEAISGMTPIEGGRVEILNTDTTKFNTNQIRNIGVSHIAEDRMSTGLNGKGSIMENMLMGKQHTEPFAKKGIHLRSDIVRNFSKKLIDKFDVRTASENVKVENLSGGNMQKVVIAREFSFDSKVLLISQPTRGVDIGAIEFIHEEIIKKRNEGCAILLVSAELDEIFRLSDRIITMYEGKVTGEFNTNEIDKSDIGYYMTGNRSKEVNS